MKIVKILSALVIIVVLAAWILTRLTLVYVPMGKAGVRIQQFSIFGSKGVVKKDFGPGWHRDLGPIDTWQLYDSTVQTLEMTRDPQRGDRMGRDDVQVQSADGYAVSVDVTVKYRIANGMAHKLYEDTGSGVKYKAIVRNQSERVCIGVFGEMKTEDFYNPEVRRAKAELVNDQLRLALESNYVEVIDVLIRDVQFDPEYEKKIRRKKLADQEVELNKSLAKSKGMAGKTQVIEAETVRKVRIITQERVSELVTLKAETDRSIATITADADKYARQKKADADLIAAQNGAKGKLLVKQAEAEGERLRNLAMMGAGGSVIVALEMARNIELKDLTISTLDIDLLDIDGMATRFGIPALKEQPKTKK
jgi:regulator of protease activity HflC (stomatin/prohibitin superfamily)